MSEIVNKDTLIVGAGLTGLTTAYYLNKNKSDFVVIEQREKEGGVIQTKKENGYIIETGPNTGVIGQPEVAELFEDLGNSCEIEIPGNEVNKRYILKNAKWEPLPAGLLKGITTPLFTTSDKFRILGEPFRSRGKNPNETLSELVVRRMGKSFLDYAVDPFILGVYSGDPSKLVTRHALPKLYNLEQKYGSFIGGSFRKGFTKKTEREKKATRKVFSVKGGLSELTKALYEKSGKNNFYFNITNLKINYSDGFFISNFTFQNNNTITIKSKNLITTTGAYALESYIDFADISIIKKISCLPYANVAEIVLGFENWNGISADGFGGLIPYVENRDVLGVLFMSTLFKNRTPDNCTLFTLFSGGIRKGYLFEKSENELSNIVEKEFTLLMKPKIFNPNIFKIIKHKYAIPQYGIESQERFDTVDNLEKKYKGLLIGGNLKDGIGMADRIKQGKSLAERLLKITAH